jgi:hypothetical protein
MLSRILLDTNLTLLLAVGLTSRSFVTAHKRLTAYGIDDFDLLVRLLDSSGGLDFCPNVWTETSNLVRYAPPHMRERISERLSDLIGEYGETYVGSHTASNRVEFGALGLTDCVLLQLADKESTLLTADLDLYLAAHRAGHTSAMNFNHLRGLT